MMHWLLLIVRFVLRLISGDQGNGVALAARIDGRIEQRRSNLEEGSGWSLFAFWRRDHASPKPLAGRHDRTRMGRHRSAGAQPRRGA
jgi:hypothetical protein